MVVTRHTRKLGLTARQKRKRTDDETLTATDAVQRTVSRTLYGNPEAAPQLVAEVAQLAGAHRCTVQGQHKSSMSFSMRTHESKISREYQVI